LCLVRLAIPSPSLPPEELPLDDPNTDFVEATHSVVLRRDGNDRGGVALDEHLPSDGELLCLPPDCLPPVSPRFPCTGRNTLLRC
jgi:hypothetical protein